MEIKQKTLLVVEKADHKFELVCANDAPMGLIFDALMEMKGYVVSRMAQAHQAEENEAKEKMGDELPENKEPANEAE